MADTNELRISFGEWLFRMSEEDVPYQARNLAIYAAVFKIVGNDEIAKLSGMASSGKADKTFTRWKKWLYNHGWVRIENIKGGRGLPIEVLPAYHKTPVHFTDLSRKNPRRFNPGNYVERGVENTQVSTAETGVRNTPVSPKTGVENTPVLPASRAQIESPSEIVITQDNTPLGSPQAESEADKQHRQALERGDRIKGGSVAKSARASTRTKGELDGSGGIELKGSKLTIMNGVSVELAQEFPGVDLRAVCNKAAPEVRRMNYPTVDDAMSVIRKWAQCQQENDAKDRERNQSKYSNKFSQDSIQKQLEQMEKDGKL